MDLTTLAEDIVRKSLKHGCDAAEVFIKSTRGLAIEAKDGSVEAMEASRDLGVALKVIKKQRLGFSFATSLEDVEKVVNEASEGAKWTGYDEYIDIPDSYRPAEVLIFDEKIDRIKDEDVIRDAILLEKSAIEYDSRIKKVRKAEVEAGTSSTTIVNSKGVNITYKSTYYTASVTAMAQDKSDSQIGWEYTSSRRIKDINIQSIGEGASRMAINLLGSRKISPVKAPVILSPQVAVDFLEILSASLSAESVQKRRSFLVGKVGQQVVSSIIDILDDGTIAWGMGTKPVDDEGVPAKSKTIISRGVLNGYMYNTYTARKDGTESTGNAVRGGIKSLPGVGPSNLFIKPENGKSVDDLIRSVNRGILILNAMGVHTADQVSGDFSIGISGLWIERGEIVYPVKETVISDNILEMFKKIEAVGNDLKFYGSIGSPSLLVGNMDISA
jgi:PmbA protein